MGFARLPYSPFRPVSAGRERPLPDKSVATNSRHEAGSLTVRALTLRDELVLRLQGYNPERARQRQARLFDSLCSLGGNTAVGCGRPLQSSHRDTLTYGKCRFQTLVPRLVSRGLGESPLVTRAW
jgi:hypothetical protein